MGNLDSKRDWGHAKDYVEMQWRMLQEKEPDDYVIATGQQTSVRNFIEIVAEELGWQGIRWEGEGLHEIGKRIDNNKTVIRINPKYMRPSEVDTLLGDPSKALKKLGWEPKITLREMASEMIKNDVDLINQKLLK